MGARMSLGVTACTQALAFIGGLLLIVVSICNLVPQWHVVAQGPGKPLVFTIYLKLFKT